VFDASPLNYWTRSGCLGVLEAITDGSPRFTTQAVRDELRRGVERHPNLQEVLDAPWLGTVGDDPQTIAYFASYSRQIGRKGKNLGEASVLAWCKAHVATAVLDDETGCRLAKRESISFMRSLPLITQGMRDGHLDEAGAITIVDLLRDAEAYFPVSGSEFIAWAYDQQLL
jgi:hypothetical protein